MSELSHSWYFENHFEISSPSAVLAHRGAGANRTIQLSPRSQRAFCLRHLDGPYQNTLSLWSRVLTSERQGNRSDLARDHIFDKHILRLYQFLRAHISSSREVLSSPEWAVFSVLDIPKASRSLHPFWQSGIDKLSKWWIIQTASLFILSPDKLHQLLTRVFAIDFDNSASLPFQTKSKAASAIYFTSKSQETSEPVTWFATVCETFEAAVKFPISCKIGVSILRNCKEKHLASKEHLKHLKYFEPSYLKVMQVSLYHHSHLSIVSISITVISL